MFEKVNPAHPDKVADRIAGAIVDMAYSNHAQRCGDMYAHVACEVLIGHGTAQIMIESGEWYEKSEIIDAVHRIAGNEIENVHIIFVKQDHHLAKNQIGEVRCGDNGIFKGMPVTDEERVLSNIARQLYDQYGTDGKYILDGSDLIICQSNAPKESIEYSFPHATINPLGYWTGGLSVDSGATNRKLGSDMGHAVTGGGLHGKDLSKADVALNIYAHLKAQQTGKPVELSCAIGDDMIDGKPYNEIVQLAADYINEIGGFEKFAEWGLI